RDLPAIDIRHSEVRDHQIEGLRALAGLTEAIDASLASLRRDDRVAVLLEHAPAGLEHERIVIDQQDVQRLSRLRFARDSGLCSRLAQSMEQQSNRRALTGRAFDLDLAAMSLHHAVDHRQAEARAALALRREKRLEAVSACLLVHAHAR